MTVPDGFLRLLTPEESEAAQRQYVDEAAAAYAQLEGRIPAARNHRYALALQGVSVLQFGARVFHVPPVPYPAGVELQQIQHRLNKLSQGDDTDDAWKRDLLAVLDEAVAVFWDLIKPATPWDRLFWRWRPNPFLDDLSETEIGELLGFFSACRTRSRVRLLPRSTRPRPSRHVITRRISRGSPSSAPPGSVGTATR